MKLFLSLFFVLAMTVPRLTAQLNPNAGLYSHDLLTATYDAADLLSADISGNVTLPQSYGSLPDGLTQSVPVFAESNKIQYSITGTQAREVLIKQPELDNKVRVFLLAADYAARKQSNKVEICRFIIENMDDNWDTFYQGLPDMLRWCAKKPGVNATAEEKALYEAFSEVKRDLFPQRE